MNIVNNKKPKKNNDKPSALVVNPVFAKPRDFMKHFEATKKSSLSLFPQQTYQPNYKYTSPMVSRSSLQPTTSAASGSNESSRKVSFGGANCKGATSSSNSSRRDILTPSATIENFFSSKSTTSSLGTPISIRQAKNVFTTPSSSQTRRSRSSATVTPKSSSSATTATSNQSRVIVAITEGRGNACGQVGLAAMDVRRPCLIMCQLSDTHNYHNTIANLNVLNPSVLLFPNTIVDNPKNSNLLQRIEKKFPTVTLTSVHRRFFNDQEGMDSVKALHLPECSSIELLVVRKYFTLAAVAALVKYVEYIENVTLASGSLPMEHQSLDEIMMIDFDTMNHLELILSHSSNSEARSLFGVLNQCSTYAGKKRLRSAILQPSCIKDDLNARLDCVTELAENPELRQNIQNALAQIPDIETLLKICFIPTIMKPDDCSISMMNYIILLKTTLDVIPNLYELLRSAKTKHFEKMAKSLTDSRLKDMASEIDELFIKDTKRVSGYAASQFQRCFAIKPDVNGLLDVARYVYSELITEFNSKVEALSEEYQLPLKCQNTSTKGYHLTLDVKGQRDFRLENLPNIFIQAQRNRNVVTMTTEDLIFMNERIKQALQEIQLMNNAILRELLQKIREKTGCLYNLCDDVAELDVIVSLSKISSNGGYTRPVFGSKLVLKSARHPILDFTSSSVPIGNDVTATDRNNFHIITGPNMGGKSIYIKQIALIQIMAQIGCYVPAVTAEVKLMDHLFSRISFDDSIECSSSHFTVELKEMEHILRTKTKCSLAIIDEFCRGTATDEGTAIAWAVSEEFIDTSVYVFFATHFHLLAKLQDFYPSVSCWYFDAEIIEPEGDAARPRLHFTHKLLPGVVSIENYGLMLAESTALPQHMKEAANKLAENLKKTKQQSLNWHINEETKKEIAAEQLILELHDMMRNNELTPETLATVLEKWNIAGILSSEEQDHEEENIASQDSDAATIIQQSRERDENYDLTDHGSDSNVTGIDEHSTDLDSEPEMVSSVVRSQALESIKLYESVSSLESEEENTPKQLVDEYYRSSSEEDIEQLTAEDNTVTNEYETKREDLDVTSTAMDTSFTGFAFMHTPQNHSSTPINSQNWNSARLNNDARSISGQRNKNDNDCDLGLHSLLKRAKKTEQSKDDASSLLLPHRDGIFTPVQSTSSADKRFLTSDVRETRTTMIKDNERCETPSILRYPTRKISENEWNTPIRSENNRHVEKMDCSDDESTEKSDKKCLDLAKRVTAESSQRGNIDKPASLQPNLDNISWMAHSGFNFEQKNDSSFKFDREKLNVSANTKGNTSNFQKITSNQNTEDQINQGAEGDFFLQLSKKSMAPVNSPSVSSSPFLQTKPVTKKKRCVDMTQFFQSPQQVSENPRPFVAISPTYSEDTSNNEGFTRVDSFILSQKSESVLRDFQSPQQVSETLCPSIMISPTYSENTSENDGFVGVDSFILSQESESVFRDLSDETL